MSTLIPDPPVAPPLREEPEVVLEDFEVPAWQGLVPRRLHRALADVVQASLRDGTGDAGVVGRIRDLALSEGDQVVLRLAWRLWRGWGPAVEVQHLQGIERDVLVRLLIGVAAAGAPGEVASVLEEAARRTHEEPAEEEPTTALRQRFGRLQEAKTRSSG